MNLFSGARQTTALSLMSTTWVACTMSIRAIVAVVFLQLAFDFRRVADEKKLVDVRIFAQRHDGAGHEIRRPKIAAHRIQCDLHWWETLRI